MAQFVAYLRVSTDQQGRSGLGLDAQRAAIESYVGRVGGTIVATFQEIESGANSERAELLNAFRACRISGAMLVVAKLDRLARSVKFISQLMDSGVDFIAADMPEANRLTMHIIAAIAEYERQVISDRTRNALARLKLTGKKLGNPRVAKEQPAAVVAASRKADTFARKMVKVLRMHDPQGQLSASKLADIFNIEGVATARKGRGKGNRNGKWSAASVIALRRRLAKLDWERAPS